MKGGHCFEIAVRMDNLLGGDLGEIQNKAHGVRSMHSRSSSFSVVFMCLISATQNFKLEKSTLNTQGMRLAQLGEHRSAEREAVGSNPGRTNTQGL